MSEETLTAANSALEFSDAAAQVAGPGLAGALVQLLSAPLTLLADAASFLVSAICLASLPSDQRRPTGHMEAVGAGLFAGIRFLLQHPTLRAITLSAALFNLFDHVLFAVYLLYLRRAQGLSAGAIGLIFTLGGLGGVLAAPVLPAFVRRFGRGATLTGGIALAAAGELAIAFAGGGAVRTVGEVALAEAAVEFGALLFSVNAVTLRQVSTAPELRGRVSAAARTITVGAGPLGALAGGLLGAHYGLRTAVLIAGAGTVTAAVPLLLARGAVGAGSGPGSP